MEGKKKSTDTFQKNSISIIKLILNKSGIRLFVIAFSLSILPVVYADGWTSSQPSHNTLYSDTITSRTDASSVSIADSQGLFVTGDVTTLGKMGVGTTTPATTLDITKAQAAETGLNILNSNSLGSAHLRVGYSAAASLDIFRNGGIGDIFINAVQGTPIRFQKSGADTLTIDSTGNVGIGTTAPVAKLSVIKNDILTGNIPLEIGNTAAVGDGSTRSAWIKYFGTAGLADTTWVVGSTGNDFTFSYLGARATAPDSGSKWMTIQNGGNVGIGTTAPAAKLQVLGGDGTNPSIKTDGYIEDVGGVVGSNMISSHSWTISSGSVGEFGQNGQTSENSREWGVGPHGNRVILWKGGNDAGSDADGGWDSYQFPIDNAKAYRLSVWIKKTISSGSTYFGIAGQSVTDLNGNAEGNPYFFCGGLPQTDRWYLLVGYIHSKDDSSTSASGGLYDGVTGQKLQSFGPSTNCNSEFKFTSSSSVQVHRTYLYYDTNTANRQYWWDPRFEEVNGKEPTVEALLGLQKPATQGANAYFGGNVGIGVASPQNKLSIGSNLHAAGDGILVDGVIRLAWGTGVPVPAAGNVYIWLDSADGDLKAKFSNGAVRILAQD